MSDSLSSASNQTQAKHRTGNWRKIVVFAAMFAVVTCLLDAPSLIFGVPGYSPKIPNYSVNSCNTCHGPSGPGNPTQFKVDFANANHTWTAALAMTDSDGDGFTNGEELQDPSGTSTADPTGTVSKVSSPSNINSTPPAPVMTDVTPLTNNGTVSITVNLGVTLGTLIGVAKVDYQILSPGTSTVLQTFTNTTPPFGLAWDTRTMANGAYDVKAIVTDKRSVAAGGARTASLTKTNITVSNSAVVINSEPNDVSVLQGANATFGVFATGSGTLTYQWYFGGGMLNNQTSSSLTITGATANDAGTYDVVVTDGNGNTATSRLAILTVSQNQVAQAVHPVLVSAALSGAVSIGASHIGTSNNKISADGRFIVFEANAAANDLVANDTNNNNDTFVRDTQTNTTFLLSINAAGTGSAAGFSYQPVIAANGNAAVFLSGAADLVATDTNGQTDVFLRNWANNTTKLVSVDTSGAQFSGSSSDPVPNADGSYVAFVNGNDIFLASTAGAVTTVLATPNSTQTGGADSGSSKPIITPDGRYVVYYSGATNLINGLSAPSGAVYRFDRVGGTVVCVSVNTVATTSVGGTPLGISADGNKVLFSTTGIDQLQNVYIRDITAGTTTLVSSKDGAPAAGDGSTPEAAMTPDGSIVAFGSNATNLTSTPDNNGLEDVYLRNTLNNTTVLVSATDGSATLQIGGQSYNINISANGRFVAFRNGNDLYRRDTQTLATARATTNITGNGGGDSLSDHTWLSTDGSQMVFDSFATNLVAGDTNGKQDVFKATYNTSPTVNAGPDAIINEGDTFTFATGSFTDPDADTWTATVNYGDGSGSSSLALTGKTFSLSHQYLDDGFYTITVTVTDSVGGIGTDFATVTVNNVAPTVVINGATATVVEGSIVNLTSTVTVPSPVDTAFGFIYAWSVMRDGVFFGSAATANFSFNTSLGAHTYVVSLTATDKEGASTTSTKTITTAIIPPVVTSAPLAIGSVSKAFSYSVIASNTPSSYTLAGALPAGLAFNTTTGVLSGTATASGTFPLTMSASNASGAGATAALSLIITPSAIVAALNGGNETPPNASVATGKANFALDPVSLVLSYTVEVFGVPTTITDAHIHRGTTGVAGPVAYTLYSGGGSFDEGSTLTGTVTLTAADVLLLSNGGLYINVHTTAFPAGEIRGQIETSPLIISSKTANGNVGSAFTYKIVSVGFPAPTFNATGLPAGLTFSVDTISGTPTSTSTTNVTMTATNSQGTDTETLLLTIAAAGAQAPVITSPQAASGTVGLPFTYQVTATNNPTSFAATGLPALLTIDSVSGAISGTPTTAGASVVTVMATGSGGSGSQTLLLNVTAPVAGVPTITSPATASATVGLPFTYTITGTNSPASFTASGLPAPLALTASTGVISGTPTAAGVFNIALGATAPGGTGNGALTLTITAPVAGVPTITSPATASASVGVPFSYGITATNSPASFSATGLPSPLTVSSATGVITGTPTAAGLFSVTIKAVAPGGTGSTTLTLTVTAPPVGAASINSAISAVGTVGSPFSYTITATNTPTSFTATGLPSPFILNASTGVISGTPSAAGTFTVTIGASNAAGGSATSLTLLVNPLVVAPRITSALTASATQGQPFTYTITASGSAATFTATNLPAGLSIVGNTISGSPAGAGSADVTLGASNAAGSDSVVLRLTIAKAAGGGANKPPVFSSAPGASPDPALTTDTVTFTAAATDPDGDLLSFTWDFGDSTSGIGGSPTHNYTAAGIYTAVVTVSDGVAQVARSINVAVNDPVSGGGVPSGELSITKGALKFSFSASNKDSLSLSGSVPLGANFKFANKKVQVNIGDLERTFTLTDKAAGGDKLSAFKLLGKKKDGVFTDTVSKFTLALKSQDLFTDLENLGFTNDTIKKPGTTILIPIVISIDGVGYVHVVTVMYTATKGKTGSAK